MTITTKGNAEAEKLKVKCLGQIVTIDNVEVKAEVENVEVTAAVEVVSKVPEVKAASKPYSINPAEDAPVRFNHLNIYFRADGTLELEGHFECQKIETAYNRFKKIMAQVASEVPELEGWGDDNAWTPAEKLTLTEGGDFWINENGDNIFYTRNGEETICVDINEDIFYLFGYFRNFKPAIETAAADNANVEVTLDAPDDLANEPESAPLCLPATETNVPPAVDEFSAKESELKENIGFALDAQADAAANLAFAKNAYDNAQFQFSVAEDIKIRAEQSYREFVFGEAERLNKLPLVDKVCAARDLCLSVNFDIKTQLFKVEHGIAPVAGAKITLGAFKTPALVESFLLSLLPDDTPNKPATFKVGEVYQADWYRADDTLSNFKILSRSAKFVTVMPVAFAECDAFDEDKDYVFKAKIRLNERGEFFKYEDMTVSAGEAYQLDDIPQPTVAPFTIERGDKRFTFPAQEEYYEDIQRQIAAIQPTKPQEGLDSLARGAAIDARNFGRQFPRAGQPSFDAPLIDWYRERETRWRLMVEELEATR